MCADTTVRNNLAMAMAVLLVGGGCLGWVGNKAVDYTFSDVRQNTEARIELTNEVKHLSEEVTELKDALAAVAIIKEMVVRIDERTANWEPQNGG
jgi:hypothetical protein